MFHILSRFFHVGRFGLIFQFEILHVRGGKDTGYTEDTSTTSLAFLGRMMDSSCSMLTARAKKVGCERR
jgi:hypothetical protein